MKCMLTKLFQLQRHSFSLNQTSRQGLWSLTQQMGCFSRRPSIFCGNLIQRSGSWGCWSQSQLPLGEGEILPGTIHRTNVEINTGTPTVGQAIVQPIKQICTCLDCGRKLRRAHARHGEDARNSEPLQLYTGLQSLASLLFCTSLFFSPNHQM